MDSRRIVSASIVILALAGVTGSAHAQEAPIADAAERGDHALVSSLFHDGADVNAAQAGGMTALLWAVYRDDVDMAGLLVRAGAEVNAENDYGVPALALACTNGSATVVDLLLDGGADVNAKLLGGETVLMIAARTGSLEVVERLLADGADVHALEGRQQTALMWAAAEGHVAVVEALIDSGADAQATLGSGFTSMFFAVRAGHIEVALSLLEAGVDVNALLEAKKDVGNRGANNASFQPIDDGMSPLLLAVRNGHFELAVELIKAGADVNDERTGFTPLHTMSWVRKPDESDRGDPAPVGSGNLTSLDFVRTLVAMGADVNRRLAEGTRRQPNSASRIRSGGTTPFLLAADRADATLMRLLMELGADPFVPNARGTTALMAATGLGTTAPEEEAGTESEALIATQLMLELGADVNTMNDEGDTAMHGAAYGSFPKIVQLLADHGADALTWNQKNVQGWTPLFIAEGYRFGLPRPAREVIQVLETLLFAAGMTTEGERPAIVDIYERGRRLP
jgi:ankyrin repeat protein